MHLMYVVYVYAYNNIYNVKNIKTIYNLEHRKYVLYMSSLTGRTKQRYVLRARAIMYQLGLANYFIIFYEAICFIIVKKLCANFFGGRYNLFT
jgi:hypothetical protein